MLNKLVQFLFIFTFFSIIACKQEQKKQSISANKESKKIEYAKGFDIDKNSIIIKSPYPKSKETFTYSFSAKNSDIPHNITKLVVTSTTHIPSLELLNKEHVLVGFPHTKYISSEKTRARIDRGFVEELGKEHSLNTEVLLDLNPDLVISFSMGKMNKTLTTIQQAGIPVILNGDWLEETPLGRAEWIKLFGAVLNEQHKADSIFIALKIFGTN